MNPPQTTPDALMLLAPGCAYCPAVLQALTELVKAGAVGRIEVVNIAVHPEVAQTYGVRSVPWVRIGEFELSGARSPAELAQWAQRVGRADGMRDYFAELLRSGGLAKVIEILAKHPRHITALIELVADVDADLHVRIGVGAALEHLQGTPALAAQVDALGKLTQHADPRVRADACHYLALTTQRAALAYVAALLHDPDQNVREIAAESLATLAATS